MLEEMARDVTGWGAHVVEFFQLLGWTQNLNHLRYTRAENPEPASPPSVDCVGTVNLRSRDVLDRRDGAFDIISHTVDVRPISDDEGCIPLFMRVAKAVMGWNKQGNCGIVVGATYPEELRDVRKEVGNLPILIPGLGAQGGEVEPAVKYGMSPRKKDAIYNSSRAIIFASKGADFAEAARGETLKLHKMINQYRDSRVGGDGSSGGD